MDGHVLQDLRGSVGSVGDGVTVVVGWWGGGVVGGHGRPAPTQPTCPVSRPPRCSARMHLPHGLLPGTLRHETVLRPFCEVGEVEGQVVCLCEDVKVYVVVREQIIAGEAT